MTSALRISDMTDSNLYANLYSQSVSFSSAGDNIVVSGKAGQQIHIYRIFFTVAGSTNITFKDGTVFSFTGAMTCQPGASFVLDISNIPWFETSAGNSFVINSSNAVQISGAVYFQQKI